MSELAVERSLFEAHLEEWRESHMHEFVLIKDDQVVGFYPTLAAAFKEGTQRFGLQPFLVEQVSPKGAVNVSFYGRPVLATRA